MQALAKSLYDTHREDDSLELVPEAPSYTPTLEDLRDGLLPYLKRILPEVLPWPTRPTSSPPRRPPVDTRPRYLVLWEA